MIQRAELRSVKKLIQVGVDFVLIKELVTSEFLCTSNVCIFLIIPTLFEQVCLQWLSYAYPIVVCYVGSK